MQFLYRINLPAGKKFFSLSGETLPSRFSFFSPVLIVV